MEPRVSLTQEVISGMLLIGRCGMLRGLMMSNDINSRRTIYAALMELNDLYSPKEQREVVLEGFRKNPDHMVVGHLSYPNNEICDAFGDHQCYYEDVAQWMYVELPETL